MSCYCMKTFLPAGCQSQLQLTRSQIERYEGHICMTYHLVQPSTVPLVIKDKAWFVQQTKHIMEAEVAERAGLYRSFYVFDHK